MSRPALCTSSPAVALAPVAAPSVVPGLTTGPAVAQVLLLKAVDSGTYNGLGDHTARNENCATGAWAVGAALTTIGGGAKEFDPPGGKGQRCPPAENEGAT